MNIPFCILTVPTKTHEKWSSSIKVQTLSYYLHKIIPTVVITKSMFMPFFTLVSWSIITKPGQNNQKGKNTHRAHQGKRREEKMSSSWLPWLENIYSHTTQFITKRQSDDVLFPIALNSFSDHYAVYVCLCVSVAEVKAKVTGREMAINLLELKSNSEKNTNAIVCTLKHSHTFKFNLNECPEYIGAYKFAK